MFRVLDLLSRGPGSDHLDLFHGSPVFKSKATLKFVNSQLVCLPPVGIFNICYVQFVYLCQCFIVRVAKWHNSAKYFNT